MDKLNQMISPFIEKSISIPLRINNLNLTMKVTTAHKYNSPNQLMLHRKANNTTSKHSTNYYQRSSSLVPKISNDNCPIKLCTSSKRTYSKMEESYLSKRVRLDLIDGNYSY